ncbi:GroES-like protein [Lentinula raphanica]|uniref:GroES-like protein n=1 Tax=Lentinula raphanica TaxID=153919 RepID=A0AA38PHF3_9AGAR|nr:GroES-like protein [Lentinula raphanica]
MSSVDRVQKALVVDAPKTPFVLKTVPIPKPGPGEVLVKIIASGLNPIDWILQTRDPPVMNTTYPAIFGFEGAGDVEEVGENVENFSKGDRVFFRSKSNHNEYSGFQQYALAPTEFLGKIPNDLSHAQAASVSLTFTTAVYGLLPADPIGAGLNPTFDDKVKFPGEAALVVGGSSSVGQYAIQILRYAGFGTIIAYASSKHAGFLKSLGATHVIDRTEVPFADLPGALHKIYPHPVKTIYSAITSVEAQDAAYASLSSDGKLIVATIQPVPRDGPDAAGRKVYGVIGTPYTPVNRSFGLLLWKHLPKLLQQGVIQPNRIEEIPNGLLGVVDGLKKLEHGEVSGVKLVVFPQQS